MKHPLTQDDELFDDDEDLLPSVSAQVEHLSRKWAEDAEKSARQMRRGPTRRRIEDWREERELRRAFDDDYDLG